MFGFLNFKMKAAIQRVSQAHVVVNNKIIGKISDGLLIFLGIADSDSLATIEKLADKIINFRVFNDNFNKMNLSLLDIGGSILIISQFTLFASTKKGNKPSWHKAANSKLARTLYDQFINFLQKKYLSKNIKTGFFGKNMQINLTNDGPITIILDSKNRI